MGPGQVPPLTHHTVKRLEFQVLPLEPMGVGPESRPRPLCREALSFQTSGPLSVWYLFRMKGSRT